MIMLTRKENKIKKEIMINDENPQNQKEIRSKNKIKSTLSTVIN